MMASEWKHEVGDRVAWKSQAGGSWKTKEGVVLARVPDGDAIPEVDGIGFTRVPAWRADPLPGHIINGDRYVVRVGRKGKKGQDLKPHYYVPMKTTVEKGL